MKKLCKMLVIVLLMTGCAKKDFSPEVVQTTTVLSLGQQFAPEELISYDEENGYHVEVLESTVNTNIPGEYYITYRITSKDNRQFINKTFHFMVADEDAPVLSIEDEISLAQGNFFNIADYAFAVDSREGDISNRITYEGTVNPFKPGTYTITVHVADSFNNTASKEVRVTVKEADKQSYMRIIVGEYSDKDYTSGQAPTLNIRENGTFILYINGCSFINGIEGTYILYEDTLYLTSESHPFSDIPEENIVSFKIQANGSLMFMGEFEYCAPNYGDIFERIVANVPES